MALDRVLSTPLTEAEANSLTDEEKEWLRNWNRQGEIPGEDSAPAVNPLYPNGQPDAGTAGDYSDMTNDELRDALRDRDLPTSGNKDDLIARLQEDDADTGESEEDDDEE
jgi:hypothetical protein